MIPACLPVKDLAGYPRVCRAMERRALVIRSPEEITVGEILRMMDQSSESLYRMTGMVRDEQRFEGSGIFLSMWTKAHKAMIDVLNNTTIQNLLDQSRGTGNN